MPIDWEKLDDSNTVSVPAKPESGLWTPVRSLVNALQIIKFEATGEWRPIAGMGPCTADGFKHWAFGRERLLTNRAPIGALIARVGGSNISTLEPDILVVGTIAVILVPDKVSGPLYLTINDAPGYFDDNSGALEVTIS
jgi:hypothetical protein